MPAQPPPSPTQRAPRPVAVSIVVALAFGFGTFLTVRGVLALLGADGERRQLVEAVGELVYALLAFAVCIGGLRVERWAWVLFMSWAVFGLTLGLLRVFFFDDPTYWRLALGTVAVFLLTPLDVQIAFGVRNPPHVRTGNSPGNPVESV
jgi:hypothetical protein